ncbi:MAG: aminoacyl-tRNA hydrolase [Candidatus Aminicenantes bacterium]|nr:aminoacyl-tRNA hydrolase [Candidatus Aminicenantes bacterium]
MWAVVGLGNPDRRYAGTRHNAGFMFVKRLAKEFGVRLKKRRFEAKTVEVGHQGQTLWLILPQTYMNRSGASVRQLLRETRVEPERVVLVYDDLDIPLGEIRVRAEGGPGTHKGLQSIIDETETTKFPRIRLGIGPLPEGQDAADFVLSDFGPEDKAPLEESLVNARAALELILAGQLAQAMSRYN